jgi:MoxR-like ATPase
MMRLSLGYPDRDSELSILEQNPAGKILEKLRPVLRKDEFLEIREAVKTIYCHSALREALADIVRDTRIHRLFTLGVSPRGALHFLEAAKALALVKGRSYIIDEDLLALVIPVLAHRVRIKESSIQKTRANAITTLREICLARLEGLKNPV